MKGLFGSITDSVFWSVQAKYGTNSSIESLDKQEFSVAMFVFLMMGIALFSVIVFGLMFGGKTHTKMRTGEKIMFAAIVMGIVAAIAMAAMQMLQGYLL